MNNVIFYEISNEEESDAIYSRLFTKPGILILKEFPLTRTRIRVLRQSFSYDEIVEEIQYCIGSRETAERLARWIIDGLLLKDAFFLYPELIRPVIEASIATIVKDRVVKQQLDLMLPHAAVFYIPDENYGPVTNAFDVLKRMWERPKNFPRHLRPLEERIAPELPKI